MKRVYDHGARPFGGGIRAVHNGFDVLPASCPGCGDLSKDCARFASHSRVWAQGLVNIHRRYMRETRSGRTSELTLRTTNAAAAGTLTLFRQTCVREHTHLASASILETWTTAEGFDLLMDIENAATHIVYASIPEVGRRLHAHPEVFDAFRAARALDADQDVLLQILQPIKKLRR